MTKRFTNVNEDIFQYGEWYCSAKSEHCADVIATALNMVTEENEQLKKENNKLHQKIFEMRTNVALDRTEISRQSYTPKEFLDKIEKW